MCTQTSTPPAPPFGRRCKILLSVLVALALLALAPTQTKAQWPTPQHLPVASRYAELVLSKDGLHYLLPVNVAATSSADLFSTTAVDADTPVQTMHLVLDTASGLVNLLDKTFCDANKPGRGESPGGCFNSTDSLLLKQGNGSPQLTPYTIVVDGERIACKCAATRALLLCDAIRVVVLAFS
jgi:hypothetical protein